METSAPPLKRAPATAATPAPAPAEPNGSEILVRCLQAENVRYLWGYPGGAVLYIYDALYKQETIQHVLVRHEQAAVHAADGYARATGEVGVALVTSGPGVTNAVTGIATAYMDSIPMVIVTGQVPTPAIGLDAFQECDTVGITRPIVKHNFLVKDVRDLAMTMKKAFHIARTGRPGPVVVDVPKDVSMTRAPFHYPASVEMRSYNPVKKGHGGQIRKAAQLLLAAKRPYIYTGGGVVIGNASAELRALVDLLGFPCTNTLMGLGALPVERPEVPRHARHARHLRSEHDDAELRRPARRRRPLRRPRHRQPEALRVGREEDHPHRHRPVVDLQARQGRRADRRRRQGRAAGADRADPRGGVQARRQGALAVVGADQRVAQEGLPGLPEGRRRRDQAAARRRDALAAHQGPRDLHHLRRRPAPDVGGAVLPLRGAAPLDQLRRPRHDGRRPAVRDGDQARQARGRGRLHHRRGLDPDVHPGALDLPAVQDADQDHLAQQPLPRHGAAVAADRLRRPLLAQLHGRAARLRQARRGLRPRRHPHRQARARSSRR